MIEHVFTRDMRVFLEFCFMTNHDSELIVYCQLQGAMDFAMLGPEDSQTLDILVGNQSSCQFFLLPFELPAASRHLRS